jgi:PAS domain-containing protein
MTLKKPSGDYDAVPFAVIVVGTDGCVSSGNAIAHRMLGLPDGALRGQRVDGLVQQDVAQIYSVFEAGLPARLQTRMLKADGRVLAVNLAVEPNLRDGDQILSVTLVCKPVPPWQSLPPPGPNGVDI